MLTTRGERSKSPKSLTIAMVLAALVLVLASSAQAGTLTVCASGCNYTTIAAALGGAASGDTISILDAVHNETGIVIGANSALNVTIQGQGVASTAVDGGGAGPIFTIDQGSVVLQDLTVQNGSNSTDGGGIVNWDTLTLSNCALSGNSSTGINGSSGGGLANFGGTVAISNCTVSANKATSFGGGILNTSSGTMTITSSTLSNNTATDDGGGLANVSGTVTMVNSTVSGNGAALGAGIANEDQLAVSSSTIANNSASSSGGGIDTFNPGFNTTLTTVKNTIVGDNTGSDCAGALTAMGANLETDPSCGTANFSQVTSAQLNLGPLALNPPGSTETQALWPGSAAINTATDCTDAFGNPVTVDQRGVPRPQLGTQCDIGAFEAQAEATSAVTNRIDLGLLSDPNDTAAGTSVTMGAFVHDNASVITTVDPIPAGSSVTFMPYPSASCAGTQSPTDTVSLNGGAMTETVESSGTNGVAADGPLPVGAVSYSAVFNSGVGIVPNSTVTCATLTVASPISQFSYTRNQDPTIYNCTLESLVNNVCPTGTQEATATAGTPDTYVVTVVLTNQTGLTVYENVSGSLATGKGISVTSLNASCGNVTMRHNGQVFWNSSGSAKGAGFAMASGAPPCTLQATIVAGFKAGQQALTGQWSTTQSETSPVTNQSVSLTSPLTGSLAVSVQ